jgi:hypothetical protein
MYEQGQGYNYEENRTLAPRVSKGVKSKVFEIFNF